MYIQVYNKSYESRKAKISYNLEWREYFIAITNEVRYHLVKIEIIKNI
jgi:hypothetical protein